MGNRARIWRARIWRAGTIALFGMAMLLSACDRGSAPATRPPRANDAIALPGEPSVIAIPVEAPLSVVTRAIERDVPQTLWTIDQQERRCVPANRVRVLGQNIRLTPDLGCRITGRVTRGSFRFRGEGDELVVDMPIRAVIAASRVGGTSLHETATGSANVQARIRLSLDRQWHPVAQVRLRYGWRTPPGIDFLGNRITFTDQADERLAPVVRQLERTLAQELDRIDTRSQIAVAWRESFATLSLNDADPPVWMQVTPQKLSFGGYRIVGNQLTLRLGMEALTRTFVGAAPTRQESTPLPLMSPPMDSDGVRFFVPVVADYDQLRPALVRALDRRAQRPFVVEGVGPITARFSNVEVYGTTGGRVAVGADIFARGIGSEPTRARVWLTALPANQPGNLTVRFSQIEVVGSADSIEGNLALRLAQSGLLGETLAEALTQNFTRDVAELRGRIDRAIADNRQGAFVIRARLDRLETGVLRAAGRGLYLPVWASGEAQVSVRGR